MADDAPPEACDSCGTTDEPLSDVRRLYVTPASWESEESVQPADEERWCLVCRTHYPHAALSDTPPTDGGTHPVP